MEFRLIIECESEHPESIALEGRHWRLSGSFPTSNPDLFPKFTAISYRWGPHRILSPYFLPTLISDQAIPSLRAAMRTSHDKAFWTDCFCVPPEGHVARLATLESMGLIYSRASTVAVVLAPTSNEAIRQMCQIGSLDETGLNILEEDEWVNSVWTYQEVANPQGFYLTNSQIGDCSTVGDDGDDGNSAQGAVVNKIEDRDFLNILGTSTDAYRKDNNLPSYLALSLRYPSLSSLEDICAEVRYSGFAERAALRIMANLDRRKWTSPQNYFYAALGAITREPVTWGAVGDGVESVAERFMRVCEKKGDWSFVFANAPREEKGAGKAWRPKAGMLHSPMPWYMWGEIQSGCVQDGEVWLEGMLRLDPSEDVFEKGRERCLSAQPNALVTAPIEIFASRLYEYLVIMGFTGKANHVPTELGVYFPCDEMPAGDVHIIAATKLRWSWGAAALASVTVGEVRSYVTGVFVGFVPLDGHCAVSLGKYY
ncbi:hypothetical protein MMC25_008015 [Agyrium rufum]|nr:hypothetical protein [Agyrium rufum]